MKITALGLAAFLTLATADPALARETPNGEVQIPLAIYQQLVEAAKQPRRAPSGFALGSAEVDVRVEENAGRASAEIRVALDIQVFEDQWVLVPILPPATPVGTVTVDGKPVQLMSTPAGLAWGVQAPGSYAMKLHYTVDAVRSSAGFTLPLPLPEAAATKLRANLPGDGLEASAIPAAGVSVRSDGGRTTLTATVPTTPGVQLSWRSLAREGHTLSRAVYSGTLVGDAIEWTGELSVELPSNEPVTLELLPVHVTLDEVKVDGAAAPVAVSGGSFAAVVRGRGAHRVSLSFQVPVQRGDGPPQVRLEIPQIPISRFELTLPGRKEVTVQPASNVAQQSDEKSTRATFNVPMTRHVELSWTEAVPEDLATETRAHASVFHAFHAEEGVLYAMALLELEVARGELRAVELELPGNVQVNRIQSGSGGISDWRVTSEGEGASQLVTVFLDHPLTGALRLAVDYDRSLPDGGAPDQEFAIPLLTARAVQRQRGMVALLSTSDVALRPETLEGITRVGENQLPAFFRERLDRTVAHTFKYVETGPTLRVATTRPEPSLAKFDAEVNTLISLTDVTLKGSASVDVNVKSGGLASLQLELPPDVNLLSLSAPSLRSHRGQVERGRQRVDVEFTQNMEGQFRVTVVYERITTDADSELSVPTLRVVGAEVEQGRIAVEALAAMEVQTATADQLSSVDPSDLPQQLILKTTNPILLAFKYVHVDPPHALALRITRHQEIAVQSAAIDRADYRTLFTADGLAVTTARFTVRNSRKQFLRVRLPAGAEVWSAAVDGRPEKPALSESAEGEDAHGAGPEILIKVINSAEGFPVELVYATPVASMGWVGRVGAALPKPDMVVTRSRWDVYLPDRFRYAEPDGNMDLVETATPISAAALQAELDAIERAGVRPVPSLPIRVPSAGVHLAFEKLYANQAEDDAAFAVSYATVGTARLGQVLFALLVLASAGFLVYRGREWWAGRARPSPPPATVF